MTTVRETFGSFMFRTLKMVDTGQVPPVSVGVIDGTTNGGLPGSGATEFGDNCWPGPGGGTPSSKGTGGVAGGGGGGPGKGPTGTVRAPGGPGSSGGGGTPGTAGDGSPGAAAAGKPGAGGGASGFGAEVATFGGP
jgi:hypothetical protein